PLFRSRGAADARSTQEWLHFLDGMPPTLEQAQLAELDRAYEFTGTANGEIAMRWYPLAVRSGYDQANGEIEEFLEEIGRRKLIMPTYAELVKTPEGLAIAERVLEKARAGYHPITTASAERVIAEATGEPAGPVAEEAPGANHATCITSAGLRAAAPFPPSPRAPVTPAHVGSSGCWQVRHPRARGDPWSLAGNPLLHCIRPACRKRPRTSAPPSCAPPSPSAWPPARRLPTPRPSAP